MIVQKVRLALRYFYKATHCLENKVFQVTNSVEYVTEIRSILWGATIGRLASCKNITDLIRGPPKSLDFVETFLFINLRFLYGRG